MSDDLFQIDDNRAELIAALNELGDAFDVYLRPVARTTAENIQHDAQRRMRQQQSASATGELANAIVVKDDRGGNGFVVLVDVPTDLPTNVDLWFEFGTKRGQPGRAYLIPAAALEQGPHLDRIAAAVQQAITDRGFDAD